METPDLLELLVAWVMEDPGRTVKLDAWRGASHTWGNDERPYLFRCRLEHPLGSSTRTDAEPRTAIAQALEAARKRT